MEENIKDQHFLPRCYLQGFTNENGKLQTLNLELFAKRGKKPYPREYAPSQICYEEDFYTVGDMTGFNVSDNGDKYVVEKSFHRYENHYHKLIDQIKAGQALAIGDAGFLIQIIFDIKLRNKYFRDKYIEPNQSKVVNEAADELKKQLSEDEEYFKKFHGASLKDMLDLNEKIRKMLINDKDFKQKAHLSTMMRKEDGYRIALETIMMKFIHCPWVILESPGNFITSDNPGSSMGEDGEIHNFFLQKDFIFVFPLTSSLCLTISDSQGDPYFLKNPAMKVYAKGPAPQDMLETSNGMLFRHYNKIVFGPHKNILTEYADKLIIKK
ncbi:Protein of unknown function [Mucilaginibacter gossypiicola]|uniref:DUF4238 domain-containing protein n=1 Tax=Mucilaginibacter gossypiicola TaxID=551995 RepID=A0A1H8DAY1_9SPHI|nr:DUF4238 domain-containing protein [Mucilaginibacter gossypiicola]SEN04326.1 Protein of unknown function [Mucilaginibacter gossypiicola]